MNKKNVLRYKIRGETLIQVHKENAIKCYVNLNDLFK